MLLPMAVLVTQGASLAAWVTVAPLIASIAEVRVEAASTEEVGLAVDAAAEVVVLATLPVGRLHSRSSATTDGLGLVVISIAECADGFVLSDCQCVSQTHWLL